MKPAIALWAHSRSMSTAFLRMMIERGDVAVLHEPFLALAQGEPVTLPAADGRCDVRASSGPELVRGLAALGRERPVFLKEVLDYRYDVCLRQPAELAWMTHVFLVRDPRPTISSHYAIKPTVTCPEIGYEWLWELFELLRAASGRTPLVLRSEAVLRDPAAEVEAFCAAVGLPFLPGALHWSPGDRPEWQRHRGWHLDTINSSGFTASGNRHQATVDNHPRLRAFYDHHYPFYQRIIEHALPRE